MVGCHNREQPRIDECSSSGALATCQAPQLRNAAGAGKPVLFCVQSNLKFHSKISIMGIDFRMQNIEIATHYQLVVLVHHAPLNSQYIGGSAVPLTQDPVTDTWDCY